MDARLMFDLTTAEPIAFDFSYAAEAEPLAERDATAGVRPGTPTASASAKPPESPEALVTRHHSLVRRIAWQVHSRISSALEVDDLTQIGLIAVIEAARGFEDRGTATFATYAVTRVRGAMIDALRRHAATRRSAMRDRRRLAAAHAAIESRCGRTANDAEVAQELGVSAAQLATLTGVAQGVRIETIDEVYTDRDVSFATADPNPYDQLEQHFRATAVTEAIGTLPRREAIVLQLYFVEELNLEEIGRTLDIGAARVCQIKKSALSRLRGALSGWS